MSGLYPSLEDMQVDKLVQAQHHYDQANAPAVTYPEAPPAYAAAYPVAMQDGSSLYPSLNDYMGLELTPAMKEMLQHPPNVPGTEVATRDPGTVSHVVSGDNAGIRRAEVRKGVREIILCKDGDGKMGLRVRAINKGVFVAFIHRGSPAALVGLRFGDQILQINGENVAGWETDKIMKYMKKADGSKITMAVRDRPFDRTITMQKDSTGHVGFVFKEGRITAIVKDSSAARNGVLTEQQLVEVNGQNVIGMKDGDIGEIIQASGRTITITILPTFMYDHIVKSMGSSLIKKYMDHSIPDL